MDSSLEEDDPSRMSLVNETKKHVTIELEPEVFTIVPDSVEVARQEKPNYLEILDIPIEPLTPEKITFIIEETADAIRICEEKVLSQKLTNAKLGFLLMRIAESVEEYENYMISLIRFLVNGNYITGQYFIDVCERLPSYGDYLAPLSDKEDPMVRLEEVDGPVQKSDLHNIVKDIVKNAYSGGKLLGSFRVMNKSINKYMRVRTQVTEQFSRQIKSWLKLKNAETEHLDELRDRLSKLSAYLQFVNSGDTRIKPAHEIPSNDSDSSDKTILQYSMLGETSTLRKSTSMTPLEDSVTSYRGPLIGESSMPSENSRFRPNFSFDPHKFRI